MIETIRHNLNWSCTEGINQASHNKSLSRNNSNTKKQTQNEQKKNREKKKQKQHSDSLLRSLSLSLSSSLTLTFSHLPSSSLSLYYHPIQNQNQNLPLTQQCLASWTTHCMETSISAPSSNGEGWRGSNAGIRRRGVVVVGGEWMGPCTEL